MSVANGIGAPVISSTSEMVSEARAELRRRRLLVNAVRVLVLVAIIGGWELATRIGWVDPFFWGQPSRIWRQIWTWIREGTAERRLLTQILVTLEEAVLGFLIGQLLRPIGRAHV